MKKLLLCILLLLGIGASIALTTPSESPAVERAVLRFKADAAGFEGSVAQLQQALQHLITNDSAGIVRARQALKVCRLRYKSIAFFLSYFFRSESAVYNTPAKYEIEEPYMEYQAPTGLQVIEALLYEPEPASHKEGLLEQVELVLGSAHDLSSLLYAFHASDAQLLESLRLELVRVISLYISGFDAPLLKSGIEESYYALASIQYHLQPFTTDSASATLTGALSYLDRHKDFDSFDRLHFLTQYALPLQRQLGELIRSLGLELNTTPVLNYQAAHLFSKDAFRVQAFPGALAEQSPALVLLGRNLFFEQALSGNQIRSCASCHRPEQHFSSALVRDTGFDGHSLLTRNTPALLYACYQHAQFWDGKAKSLEEQVQVVLQSAVEMNIREDTLVQRLRKLPAYVTQFRNAYPGVGVDTLVSLPRTAAAIAAYLRTMVLMNAPFDRYIQGDSTALTTEQRYGFNLFMGKAQCGTCHFAPLFNGLTPPLYDLTEFEVAGTTLTDSLLHPQADHDPGRFAVFPISFYQQAFKTPTVRNAAATAPYMHNGNFATLEKVIDFYDKGGGAGLGLAIPNQTLATTPLQLNDKEKKALVRFMEALTDQL